MISGRDRVAIDGRRCCRFKALTSAFLAVNAWPWACTIMRPHGLGMRESYVVPRRPCDVRRTRQADLEITL